MKLLQFIVVILLLANFNDQQTANAIANIGPICAASTLFGKSPGLGTFTGAIDAVGTYSSFNSPAALSVNYITGFLYIADAGNNCIRRASLNLQAVSVVAGNSAIRGSNNGVGTNAKFNQCYGKS